MSTLGLLLIAFFWCSGGIYGNEALLESAPAACVEKNQFLRLVPSPLTTNTHACIRDRTTTMTDALYCDYYRTHDAMLVNDVFVTDHDHRYNLLLSWCRLA